MSRGTPARRAGTAAAVAATALAVLAGCGKKGPPLAPLRLVPAAVGEVSARRAGEEVRLQFLVPAANANGPGPVELDRIQVYAVSVAAGAAPPPAADLLAADRLIAEIPVKAAAAAGEAAATTDTRPAPGEAATFTERLTPAIAQPVVTAAPAADPKTGAVADPKTGAVADPKTGAVADPKAGAAADPKTAAAAPAPAAPAFPVRLYVLRGVTRGGRPGPPSAAVSVPLVEPPPAPSGLRATPTETAIALEWTPASPGVAAAPIAFNLYRDARDTSPVNAAPLQAPEYERAGVTFGEEQCFVVRSVASVGGVPIEGAASERACVTPRDVFPPAAPRNLSAIASEGAVNLAWDANTEADLAGYIILRGEAGGATLQQLTPTPVRENTYRDTTVTAGVTYVYAVVAVDAASPPNLSAQSAPRTETAR